MAAPKCDITAAQKAASDKAVINALNGSLKTGAGGTLNQMALHSNTEANKAVAPPPLRKITQPPPSYITKKHDLINYYLAQGLVGDQVVDAMFAQGFKIKIADVNSNIKWYGTDKIPANQPKADLKKAQAKAAKALKDAEDALKMAQGSPSATAHKDVDAAAAGLQPVKLTLKEWVDANPAYIEDMVKSAYKAGYSEDEIIAFFTTDTWKFTKFNIASYLDPVKSIVPPVNTVDDALKALGADPLEDFVNTDTIGMLHTSDQIQEALKAGFTDAQIVDLYTKPHMGYEKDEVLEHLNAAKAINVDNLMDTMQPFEAEVSAALSANQQWNVSGVIQAAKAVGASKEQAEVLLKKFQKAMLGANHLSDDVLEQLSKAYASVPGSAKDLVQLEKDIIAGYQDNSITHISHIDGYEVVDQAMNYGASMDDAYKLAIKAGATHKQAADAVSDVFEVSYKGPVLSSPPDLEQQLIDIAAKQNAGAQYVTQSLDDINNPHWIAEKAQGLGASAQEAFEMTKKSGAAKNLAEEHLAQAVESVYGDGTVRLGKAPLTTDQIEGKIVSTNPDAMTLQEFDPTWAAEQMQLLGASKDQAFELLTDKMGLDASKAVSQIDYWYGDKYTPPAALSHLGKGTNTASAAAQAFEQKVVAQTQSEWGIPDPSMKATSVPYTKLADEFVAMGASDVEVENILKELGFTDNGVATVQQMIKNAVPNILSVTVSGIQVPTLSQYGNITNYQYMQKLQSNGFSDDIIKQALKKQQPFLTDAEIDAVFTPAPAPVVATGPAGKPKIIKSYLDKKHDLIYKFRMAGYADWEIVDEMGKLGYKIKTTDVNSNKKWYNTHKIPMSSHVAKQIVTPGGVSAPSAQTVAPIIQPAPSTQYTSAPGSVPYEKAETVMVKQLAGASGSNPGGLYEDADGKKWYVKQYAKAQQAPSEKLANDVYNALGAPAPVSKVIQAANGQLYIATSYIENTTTLKTIGVTKERAEAVLDHFVVDVLTANWDAVGLELDNIVIDSAGRLIRIDQGGSLLFRAKGGLKDKFALKSNVNEWESFFSGTNPAYSSVAKSAGVSSALEIKTLEAQLDNLEKFIGKQEGKSWFKFLETHVPQMSITERIELTEILDNRTKLLLAKKKDIIEARELARKLEELAKQPFNPANLQHQTFTTLSNVLAAKKAKVPPGLIGYGPDGDYGSTWAFISEPPALVLQAGSMEAVTQWYVKYFPNINAEELSQVISKVYHKYGPYGSGMYSYKGAVPNKNTIEQMQLKESGITIPTTVAPTRAGFHDGSKTGHKPMHGQETQHGTLSSAAQSSTRQYTGSLYDPLNKALRLDDQSAIQHYRNHIPALDEATHRMTSPTSAILWRGVGSASPLHSMSPAQLMRLVGARIDDAGYLSTTLSQNTAQNFSAGRVLLRVHTPRGTKGVYVHGTSLSGHSEYEFIMPRGTQMQVTRVSFDGHYYIVDTEIVAQPTGLRPGHSETESYKRPITNPSAPVTSAGATTPAPSPQTAAQSSASPGVAQWAAKTPFKSMEQLLQDMADMLGDDTDLAEYVKTQKGHAHLMDSAQAFGWSLVQWNTFKKYLKTLA
jgi:hypothetical protein